ncbi:transposase [Actinokineospora spheciospongiae]|uniref:transposase n=1 Tax=Actinokineospora spheciospongiae TaxID=909613 RepID=UPI0013786193
MTDEQWQVVAPLLPVLAVVARRHLDHAGQPGAGDRREGAGGQGPLLQGDPRLAAGPAHPGHDPERRDQQAGRRRRARAGGRPPVFDPVAYRCRNTVERCFNRPRQFRALATRYDKTALSFQAMIDLATLAL